MIDKLRVDVVSETKGDLISAEFAVELERRVASCLANPEYVYSVDQAMEEIRKVLEA